MSTRSLTTSAASTLRHPGALLHREGRGPVLLLVGIAISLGLIGILKHPIGGTADKAALVAWGAAFALALFFRHPRAETPVALDLVVAPASGRIVHVGEEDEHQMLGERRIRLSIFLSLLNPHVTRAPVGGRVTAQRYVPARHLVAFHPKSSLLNEHNSVLIESADGGSVVVRSIAGLLARRICSYIEPGRRLEPGEEIGYIKLGSRVDVFLPTDATILVKPGQRVRAGETPLARLQ